MDGSLGRESLEQVRWSETKRGSSNRRRKRRRRGRGTGKKRERAGTGESQSVSAPPSESEKTAPLKGNRQCQPHQAKMEKKKKKSSKWQPLRETQPLSLWSVEKDVWVFAALCKAIGCLHV